MVLSKYNITIFLAILCMVGIWFFKDSQKNAALDMAKKDFKKEKEIAINRLEKKILSQTDSINNLIKKHEESRQRFEQLIIRAKSQSVNPYYDLDFLTAAAIISESRYKPGE